MLISRKSEVLEGVTKSLGERASYFVANVGDSESARNAMETTLDKFGSIDILINNAATNPYFGSIMEIDESRAIKTVQVNQIGTLVWTQAAYSSYMKENGGSVVNVASVGGLSVEWGIGFYNVTKAAVIRLTEQMAGEMGPKVRVNAVAPGLIKTKFAKALWESNEDIVASKLPLRRIGEPDDVAKVIVFLASEAAGWITGSTVVVDGGAMVVPSGGIT